MHILNEINRAFDIDSMTNPIVFSHFWSFSGHAMDFMLEPLTYLEETTGVTVTLEVNSRRFEVPATWNVVVVDKETSMVESVPVPTLIAYDHDILLFSPSDSKPNTTRAKALLMDKKRTVAHPSIPKGSALICPTMTQQHRGEATYYGIICGPHDLHRYLSGRTLGDLLT